MITNLGFYKLCIHINLREENPKAIIYEINDNLEKDENEAFVGFVNYKNLSCVDFDQSNIHTDSCSRFVYLTR